MNQLKTCLVMFGGPFDSVKGRLTRRIALFSDICENFYLLIDISPNLNNSKKNVSIIDLKIKAVENPLSHNFSTFITNILKYLNVLIIMMDKLLEIRRNVNIIIFSTGIPIVLPLMLLSKLLGKKIVTMGGGSAYISFISNNPNKKIRGKIICLLEKLCYLVSDNIAVEAEKSIYFQHLEYFKNKISILGTLTYIDSDLFSIKIPLVRRDYLVGYIGSLSEGKGVMNFLDAIPLALQYDSSLKFVIIGDGPLYNIIANKLRSRNLCHNVDIIKWVPYETVPDYLNKLRLLVLPSYSEGVPGIILEAMACGTPVLASNVGGIPDIIKNNETGFILENNSSKHIAISIISSLNHKNIEGIIKNAREVIEVGFTYRVIADKWKNTLNNIGAI